ncbi:MAG: hypothetical protein JWP12_3700 [Bacteroidetes bacterium]|nr:hypothetical protein [Bacteroidota bacterium]
MKKLLLSVFALASYLSVNAQCNELFISEYVEGSGNNKALEIYNPTNAPINLSGYNIQRFSNGASTSSSGGVLNLSGTIAAHDVFVIANGQTTGTSTSPACSPALQALADQLDGVYPAPTYMNGNDAIALFHGSTMIDLLGKIGDAAMTSGYGWSDAFPYDGSAGENWTENHTLIRKPTVETGVMTNPSSEFVVTDQWDSLSEDTWTQLGTHVCNCLTTGITENNTTVSLILYPNPANNDHFNISGGEGMQLIELYNVMGQRVLAQTGNKNEKQAVIETASLPKGVYFVKVTFASGKFTTAKISIQ